MTAPVKIGIRHEDKNPWEARIPLVPAHLGRLAREHGVVIAVQSSPQRAFREEEFTREGIEIAKELDDCQVIMGVKEIPKDLFEPGKTYVFFSHVIKGQPYNMPMLRRMMEKKCNLIDYECIVDDAGRRLVFFGVHAGLAGMIDALWTLGQRLANDGIDSPLAELEPARKYPDLAAAKAKIQEIGARLKAGTTLGALGPVVIGISGNGRVSRGAQEISTLLDPEPVSPEALLSGSGLKPGRLHQVIFEEPHFVRPNDPNETFDLQTYYDHPERFTGIFSRYLPHLTMLVNCIYWEERYPRLVTKEDLRKLYGTPDPRLRVIGDISCDIEGSIEVTVKGTDPGNPVYVYDVDRGAIRDGFEGRGPVIMAVEILPTEIPRESSLAFSEALVDLIPALAKSDPSKSFEDWALPGPLKRATILHQGRLTEHFAHLAKFL